MPQGILSRLSVMESTYQKSHGYELKIACCTNLTIVVPTTTGSRRAEVKSSILSNLSSEIPTLKTYCISFKKNIRGQKKWKSVKRANSLKMLML